MGECDSVGLVVNWDNEEKTVIHQSDDGEWTWDEFHAAQRQINQMIDSVHHKVDVIIDTQSNRRGKLPPNASLHFRNAFRNRHPNTGLIVVVGMHPFVQIMVKIVSAVTRSNAIAMVSTVEKARALAYKEASPTPELV
jgi:hypothetical protein